MKKKYVVGFFLALFCMVLVYRADGTSLYETTNIPVEALPDDLRADLDKGRYIETPEELYGFLENYSS